MTEKKRVKREEFASESRDKMRRVEIALWITIPIAVVVLLLAIAHAIVYGHS